jgi:fucose permease
MALPARFPATRPELAATRIIFFAAGIVQAAWAPLVPFAKARLAIDDGSLGILLLCLGLGSMLAMPISGGLVARFGCQRVIVVAGTIFVLILPLLALIDTWIGCALALGIFGASIGTCDVAMNLHGIIAERNRGRPMMSGFHALFSLGGIVGASGVSAMLYADITPFMSAGVIAIFGFMALTAAAPRLLPHAGESEQSSAILGVPRGIVLFIGTLCFLSFLAEGAILDWRAVFLRDYREAAPAMAGLGYAMFATAMAVGRFVGDPIRSALGEARVLFLGGIIAATGFFMVVVVWGPLAGLIGFFLVGTGASNIVPVLFSAVGRARLTQSSQAVAAVTTLGYVGILAGPALIGFVARWANLQVAFISLAVVMLVIGASFRVVER